MKINQLGHFLFIAMRFARHSADREKQWRNIFQPISENRTKELHYEHDVNARFVIVHLSLAIAEQFIL